MKRKLITAVFAMAMGLVVVGTFGSCKDYEEDSIEDLRGYQSQQLADATKKLKADILAAIKQCDCEGDAALESRVRALEETVENLNLDGSKSLLQQIQDALLLDDVVYQLKNSLGINDMDGRIEALEEININANLTKINGRIDSLALVTYNDSVRLDSIDKAHSDSLADLRASVNDLRADIIALDASAKAYTDSVVAKAVTDLDDTINVRIGRLQEVLEDADQALQDQITGLKDSIDAVADSVAALTLRVDSLEQRMTNVENALAKLVTGILVQGTENPVFGSFALPLDVRSNVLMTYYGKSESPTYPFPSAGNHYGEAAAYNEANSLTEEDLAILEHCGLIDVTIANGETLLGNEEGNAGTLYLTINPNTVDFNELPVSLVNSLDEESGIKLGALEKSDKKLTFGYTRSADNNGFYAAKATLTEEGINKVKVNIEPGLKSEMKEVLNALKDKNLSKISFADLATVIYKQFNGILDANAVKTTWTDEVNGEHSVYSQYNIAATAFKPLSYKFLEGNSYKIPTISEIDDIDLGNFDIDLELKPIEIDLSGSTTNLTFENITFNGEITVKVNVAREENGLIIIEEQEIPVDGLDDFIAELNQTVGQWSQAVNDELASQLATIQDEINAQLDKMIEDINTQLGQVDDLVDEMNGIEDKVNTYVDKVNSYINRVNNFTNRINKYLEDPNHYLQVTMLYENGDGEFRQLSNSARVASRLKVGKETVFYPTSYTGELIAPAYKKFVAVTNVWPADAPFGDISAQNGNEVCLRAIEAANAIEGMNKVLDGTTRAVKFMAPTAGLVYEITYSAVDYSGRTSTRKFYVRSFQN